MWFLAGFIILMGIITGEVYYPLGYTTRNSEISDLGSTRPPESLIFQPSATIFNTTMILTGLLLFVGTYFAYKGGLRKVTSVPSFFFSIAVMGVGIFPGNTPQHPFAALFAFVLGGVSAISVYFSIKGPYRIISCILGTTALVFLFAAKSFMPFLGDGGTERWIAYPIVLWITGLGGYLLGREGNLK